MRFLYAITFLLSLVTLGAGCAGPGADASLAPSAFRLAMGDPEAHVIDVRTAGEFSTGHLAGAVNLDWRAGDVMKGVAALDRGTPLLVYCASGRRSAAAREALLGAGFTQVHDLSGGIEAWRGEGLPVE